MAIAIHTMRIESKTEIDHTAAETIKWRKSHRPLMIRAVRQRRADLCSRCGALLLEMDGEANSDGN